MAITRPVIGEDFSVAAQKIDGSLRYIEFMTRITAYRSGMLGRVAIGGYGDSMWGYATLSGWGAHMAVARMLHHNADVMVHQNSPENGGHNYAVGGTTTQYMLDVQLPKIIAAYDAGTLPPVMWGSPLQNDDLNGVGAADAAFTRCTTFWSELLKRDIIVGSMGVHPKNGVGIATENAYARHNLERRFSEWAAKQPGMFYIPILDILKSGNPTEEEQGEIRWRGTQGAIGGATDDGTHSSCYGARLVSRRVADALRQLAPAMTKPAFEAMDFDQTRNLYANLLGKQGRLLGSGGTITDLSKPIGSRSTSSNNLPAGLELIYDASKGVTITPALTGVVDRPLSLTPSGNPTADVDWALRFTTNKRLTNAQSMLVYGEAWFVGASNWAGLGVGDGRLGLTGDDIIIAFPGAGSTGGTGHIMPDALTEMVTFSSMSPFGLRNQDARTLRYDLTGRFVQGRTPTGRVDVGWQSMYRTDNTF